MMLCTGLVFLALVLRLGIAFGTRHVSSDMEYYFSMRQSFLEHGPAAYAHYRDWAYPPGLIPWNLASIWIGDWLDFPRDVSIKLPFILADVCLVALVFVALSRDGMSRGRALVAGSFVAFGPTFVVNSAYHGQFDSLAILPAVLAVILWPRLPNAARAVVCGALIGVGAATKTMPGFVVLALLPTARSLREAAWLVGTVVAVPVVATLPFYLATPDDVVRIFGYAGFPGLGGWSVVVQPGLARAWVLDEPASVSGATLLLYAHAPKVSLGAVLLTGLLCLRRRVPPLEAACTVWLTVYAFAANFFAGYANWGLPFLLMAGQLAAVGWLTALLFPITLIAYVLRPDIPPGVATLYQVLAIVLQLTFVVLWVRQLSRASRTGRDAADTTATRADMAK